jgi:protein TonB
VSNEPSGFAGEAFVIRGGQMRTYTLAFSIVVHLFIVGGLVVVPIVANDTLPTPRRAIDFTIVRAVPPPAIPPPPAAARRNASRITNPQAAPLTPPDSIVPERELEPFESEGHIDGVPGGLPGGVPGSIAENMAVPPPPPAPKPKEPLPVGGLIQRPEKVRDVTPVYPALALRSGVQGTVILETVIGEDGRVRNIKVLRSIPLLDQAAIDAVRQWEFTRPMLNRQPVAVVMTVTVTFTLQR